MSILLFGATGMVGQGVLRECLLDSGVASVVSIGRSATGFDACFFCLGISSAGMTEEKYARITYDITVRAAETLARLNPALSFVYVSGQGTDSSEHGRIMWARVKGRTENALLRLPFKAAFMFRPGVIVPRFGARSRTALYRIPYMLTRPFLPLLLRAFPNQVLTTDEIGRAMLLVARHGAPKHILETADIRSLLNSQR